MAQYLKPDTELGYIEDQAEIESVKINNLRHTVLGCMLGDFDETGAYIVSPEIVQELIEMPKYVVDIMDNIEVCKSCLKLDKQITFIVTFEGNKATLTLVEKLSYEANFKINSGTYSNINEYVLDSVETSGEINRNVIYDRWNIGEFGGNVIDIFSCDESVLEKYFGIVNRFKYLLQANKILIEKEEAIEEIEASYTNEIFNILQRYPKLKDAIVKDIKTALAEKQGAISVNKPNFAKTFNEVLENAIQSNIGILDEKEQQEFKIEKRNTVVNLNLKRSEVIETESVDIDENAETDLNPKTVVLKTNNLYSTNTINSLGEEFVSAHKQVTERKKQETPTIENSEKGKLYLTLSGLGLGESIGLPLEKKEEAKIQPEAQPSVETKPKVPVKIAGAGTNKKTTNAKKDSAKKGPAKKGPAKKGPAKQKVGGNQQLGDEDKKNNDAQKKGSRRLFTIVGQRRTTPQVGTEIPKTDRRVKRNHTAELGIKGANITNKIAGFKQNSIDVKESVVGLEKEESEVYEME